MKKKLSDIKKNNRVQNQFALYYLLEYGKNNILNEDFLSEIKDEILTMDDTHSVIANEFAIGALNIAKDIASLKYNDICTLIYDNVKEQKKIERGR